jgi:diguanylate cyclase (GGDEF)-like protein
MDARWEMDLLFLLATWTLGGFSTFVRDMSLRQIHRTFLTLQQEATSDYLTETDNRRQLVRNLEQLWRRAQRHGWTLAIMMADLDHFKRINDEYGHDEGDEYLQAVASALSSSMNRADDIVGRYGGEEFVLISVVKSREEAERLCQRLVQEVRELELPNTASPGGRQTVSIGCVVVGPAGLQLDWSMAVKLADMLLYLQKAAGRDGYQIARV